MDTKNIIKKTYIALFLMLILILPGCDSKGASEAEDKDVKPQISVNETIKEGEVPTIIVKPAGDYTPDESNDTEMEEIDVSQGEEQGILDEAEPLNAETEHRANPTNGENVTLNPNWEYANFSKINSGAAVFYAATENRKGITVGVNAGHGTNGGGSVKTYCHPDMTPKVTGGTTAAGSIEATAVSGGMSFNNGEKEAAVNLKLARFLRDELLRRGYDVLMIRDGDDVQLDNVARTVICNNMAACHIAIHFDGDSTGSDKGCFFISVPDGIKSMAPVDRTWQMSEELGSRIVTALSNHGHKLHNGGSMDIDLTQTSFSSIPSVDVEYGNQCTDTSDTNLMDLAGATADGIDEFFMVSN